MGAGVSHGVLPPAHGKFAPGKGRGSGWSFLGQHLRRAVYVFSCPWDIPGPNPKSKTALPFPSLSLSSQCPLPGTRPWGPPGSCEEGFNLLRGSGARRGGSLHPHAPSTPMHLLFGAGGRGGVTWDPLLPTHPSFPSALKQGVSEEEG